MKIIVALLSLLLVFPTTTAAPKKELWARWQQQDVNSTLTVDHTAWDTFLADYRTEQDDIAWLDYAGVSDDERQQLQDYLKTLAATPIEKLNRNEQLAFWINLYNALTVEVILAHYPVDSIRDISDSLFSAGPWDMKLFTLADEKLSLNDIEHRILRPLWEDPRLHYAVNCASIGCPNIAAVAFTADNTDDLLNSGAQDYINHPRGVSVKGDDLIVSSIYKWFQEDFGGDDAGVINHLKKYAKDPLRDQLNALSTISDDTYNWSLNRPSGN